MDNQVIYDLLKEVRDEQRNLSEKNIEHREETLRWQYATGNRLENIEEDLREHKEGVVNNRRLITHQEGRIFFLEEEKKKKEIISNENKRKFRRFMKIGGGISLCLGIVSYILNIVGIL